MILICIVIMKPSLKLKLKDTGFDVNNLSKITAALKIKIRS